MAKNKAETSKGSFGERSLRFLRDLHIGIGATALIGAVLLPMFTVLPAVAAYEGVSAVAHEELRQAVKKRTKRKS